MFKPMGLLNFNLLSQPQCTKLVRDSVSIPSLEGRLFSERDGRGQGFTVDPKRYKARERFIDLHPPHVWLRSVLQSALDRGSDYYGLGAMQQREMPRLLTYGSSGSHFDWHVDAIAGASRASCGRRLTASIQLSDGDGFGGGDLLVRHEDRIDTASRCRGDVAIFPAEWLHRVTPVTSGCRVVLVMWGY